MNDRADKMEQEARNRVLRMQRNLPRVGDPHLRTWWSRIFEWLNGKPITRKDCC